MDVATNPTEVPEELSRRQALAVPSLLRAAALAGGAGMLGVACDAIGDGGNSDMVLMKRATFGVTGAVVDRVGDVGAPAWIAEQLDWQNLDRTAVEAKVATMPAISMTPAELRQAYPGNDIADAAAQVISATVIRQAESPAQLYERMVDFWSDHFNVPMADQTLRLLKVVEDREVIRPHALGRFKDLLVASAQSPAMLFYLDNARSFADSINENYARELLELHTLGVNGGYTEAEIVSTAELLTGWTIDPDTGRFVFRAGRHDSSFQSIVGWDRPATGNDLDHGVAFLHHLAEHPSTADFLCTKLVRRFVSDMPDPALVAELAATYLANDTDIAAVMAALLSHPTFLGSGGQKLKRPHEYMIGTIRQVGATVSPITAFGQLAGLGGVALALGQAPFQWPAPNGYPDVAGAWLNTGGLLARWNAATDIAADAFDPVIKLDDTPIRSGLSGATLAEILDTVAERVLHEPLTASGRVVLASFLDAALDDEWTGVELALRVRSIIALLLATNDNQYT